MSLKHIVTVVTEESGWENGKRWTEAVAPYVAMYNDDDPHYMQKFESREQVEAFIAELQAAADKAFGGKA